jgi:hypothetical protein
MLRRRAVQPPDGTALLSVELLEPAGRADEIETPIPREPVMIAAINETSFQPSYAGRLKWISRVCS